MTAGSRKSIAVLSARYRAYRAGTRDESEEADEEGEGDDFGALAVALASRPLVRSQVVHLLGAPDSDSAVAYDSSGLSHLVSEALGPGLSLGCLNYRFPAGSAESCTLLIVYDANEPHHVRLVHVWRAYRE